MLLSYQKSIKASGFEQGKEPEKAVDENVQTWWRADTAEAGAWLELNLEKHFTVHAVQINFADDGLMPEIPVDAALTGALGQECWIDEKPQRTRWKLEGSLDGVNYSMIEDKSAAETDLPHDLVVREEGITVQYLRLTVCELPYGQAACVSGFRVFGLGDGTAPGKASEVTVKRTGDLDMEVVWNGDTDTVGYVVEWGYTPTKLYHSYQVFGTSVHIGALVKGQEVYVRVDSFNENGITDGDIIAVK